MGTSDGYNKRMDDPGSYSIESLWDALLSRQPDQVRLAFESLDNEEKTLVLQHLHRMSEEPGWHPEQRLSAIAALEAINYPD